MQKHHYFMIQPNIPVIDLKRSFTNLFDNPRVSTVRGPTAEVLKRISGRETGKCKAGSQSVYLIPVTSSESDPLLSPEICEHPQYHDTHYNQYRIIAKFPINFRHILKIHTV